MPCVVKAKLQFSTPRSSCSTSTLSHGSEGYFTMGMSLSLLNISTHSHGSEGDKSTVPFIV